MKWWRISLEKLKSIKWIKSPEGYLFFINTTRLHVIVVGLTEAFVLPPASWAALGHTDITQWEWAVRLRCLKVSVCYSGLPLLQNTLLFPLSPWSSWAWTELFVSYPSSKWWVGGEKREVKDPLNGSFLSGIEIS